MTGHAAPMYAICMKGNIYANKCTCGGKMIHNERKHNCFCSSCGTPACKGYIVRFGRDISVRFDNYQGAAQFLNGLRFKDAEGTLDIRDYKADQPLSFVKQSEKWLDVKKEAVSHDTYRKYKRFIRYANELWSGRNVKTINFGDLEDFLFSDKFTSSKYRHDARSCINHFFDWLVKREGIRKPEFPEINFELGWRTITDLPTQRSVITEVYRIAPQTKIAFGVELLATYTSLRPDDLRRINEGSYRDGLIRILKPTKRKNTQKIIRLLPEHAEMWEELSKQYPSFPTMPYFRHIRGLKGVTADKQYGKDLFYKWWVRACKNLGVEGLDLYGGTRHSTTTAIAEMTDEATAKQASGHMTNKAFDRYCQAENTVAFKMARLIKDDRGGGTNTKEKVIDLNSRKEK